MKRHCSALLLGMLLLSWSFAAHGADSSLTEQEAPTLSEDRLSGVIRNEHCIILYYNPTAESRDDGAKTQFGATPQQLADRLMRAMIALSDRIQSPVRFYKVNWKGFKAETMDRIRSDVGILKGEPESPSIVTYVLNGPVAHRFSGTTRPDMMPWFIHEIMDYFIHSIKTAKGDYLRGGWTFTDTNASFISLTDVRKESRDIGGRTESVQIISYVSRTYDGFACRYERIHRADGRLFASIEDYGKYGKFGYFDYDGTGKMQYRVKYNRQEEEKKDGTKEQERQK